MIKSTLGRAVAGAILLFACLAYIIWPFLTQTEHKQDSKEEMAKIVVRLEALQKTDPEAQLDEALKTGDTRFLAITSYELQVPGVLPGRKAPVQKYGYKFLPHTHDGVTSDADADFQREARVFAIKYNVLLLEKIDTNTLPPLAQ